MATAERGGRASARQGATPTSPDDVRGPNRREFLYYIWGASIVMLMGQATAGLVWFALPRFKEGEFGGDFRIPPEELPEVNAEPVTKPEGRMHLVNTDQGVLALYAVCTHLGCLPKWNTVNTRFECPCHGSKFELNGDYIEGPAPRGLDRFPITILFADGTQLSTDSAGAPVALAGREVAEIIVDTGSRIDGA
jgi:cytochrome b6-f complex iron-sulfur subunit